MNEIVFNLVQTLKYLGHKSKYIRTEHDEKLCIQSRTYTVSMDRVDKLDVIAVSLGDVGHEIEDSREGDPAYSTGCNKC